MNKTVLVNKPRGLYGKLLQRLEEVDKPGSFIEWAIVYEKLCRGFSIKKLDVRETLLILRDVGLLDISPRGVKLNFEVRE